MGLLDALRGRKPKLSEFGIASRIATLLEMYSDHAGSTALFKPEMTIVARTVADLRQGQLAVI